MDEQNIFDNDTVFSGYQKLRANDANYNIQLEQPAAGFIIDTVSEPIPKESAVKIIPNILIKEQIKPTFLLVKAKK